jgi:hypothetical protein
MSPARAAGKAGAAAPRTVRADDGTEYRLRVRAATGSPRSTGTELELPRAYVPMFLWPSVPVLIRREQRLNLIERFALQAAQELGAVTATELADLTGLPERAVGPLLRHLLATGVLEASEPGSYAPTSEVALVLQEEAVILVGEAVRDFAYFPVSDELLVLDVTRALRRRLFHQRMRPVLTMPVAPPLCDEPPCAIVNRHLDAGTALGRPPTLLRALEPERPEPIGDLCPVFEASPVLCRQDEENKRHRVELTFRAPAVAGEAGDPWAVKAHFAGVDGLTDGWRRLADLTRHPEVVPLLWQALAGPEAALDRTELAKLAVEEIQSSRYALSLPEAAARALQQHAGPLGQEEWVRLEEDLATVLIGLELRPADDAAAALFALDDAASLLDGDPSPGYRAAIDTAARRFGLSSGADHAPTPEQVRDRMWELKYYQAVYALREKEDFDYS